MSGLINFIKSLFSGIFGFVGGLLGSKKGSDSAAITPAKSKKKSNGFYLELDDATSNGSSAAPSQPAAPAAAPATAEKTEKKSSKRAEQLAAAAKAENGGVKPAAPAKSPEPVTVAKALNLPEPTVTNFATDYLLTNGNNGRRRPGANMSSYLDMARQVKAPSRG